MPATVLRGERERPKELRQDRTCLVTLVSAGSSDRVLKIYPADHDEEKIWLETRPAIDRWEEVRRLMMLHCERGRAVPNPVPYHESVDDLVTPSITDADIPVCKLEGAVLTIPRNASQRVIDVTIDKSEQTVWTSDPREPNRPPDESAEKIKNLEEGQANLVKANAQLTDQVGQLLSTVGKLIDRLDKPEVSGKKKKD